MLTSIDADVRTGSDSPEKRKENQRKSSPKKKIVHEISEPPKPEPPQIPSYNLEDDTLIVKPIGGAFITKDPITLVRLVLNGVTEDRRNEILAKAIEVKFEGKLELALSVVLIYATRRTSRTEHEIFLSDIGIKST